MKTEIIKLLRETDGYLSGQELCDHLGVSRTAVWKVINQLKEEGYRIEAVRNKGYYLVEGADVITKAELESRIDTRFAGAVVEYYEVVDSTNNKAKQLAESGCPSGTLVAADYQTMGKGRRGRGWASDPGTGIWMSLVLRPPIAPFHASMLTLVAALATSAAIGEETGLDSRIKWPNDIVINRKKVCGILTEMSSELDCIHYVVIGIGINANTRQFPEELISKATSLVLEQGDTVIRSQLIAKCMKWFEHYYELFLKTEDLSLLTEEYNKRMAGMGGEVRVLEPGHEYSGQALGIDCNGELLVRTEDGAVHKIVSGEVSVRGIYGYVPD